ncbi:MAG TPA: histidine kinase [Parafilimonas sp.]|nr:histidine kinase [Parafilimonas sp.]
MGINSFVFSNNRNYRLGRHSVFWFLWILYYAIISAILTSPRYGFAKSFFEAFTEVAESTPLDMCFCYFVIYYLLPEFLYKGRYIAMLFLWLIASIAFIVLYELNATFLVPFIREWFGMKTSISMPANYTYDFFILFSQINMEGCVAASIKLGKLWYVKQQEIDLLKKEKEKIKPHEDQGLIQPAFLQDLLSRMENIANDNPMVAAQSLKKIRHLLLYILYENSSPQIPLQKELSLLEEYIYLEKLVADKEIQVSSLINVGSNNETIAPFILLPLIENAFKQVLSYSLKNAVIKQCIYLQQDVLHIEISWSKPIETSSLTNGRNVILHNISKRLQLIYPQSHELKMMIEAEKIILSLKLNLKKAIN